MNVDTHVAFGVYVRALLHEQQSGLGAALPARPDQWSPTILWNRQAAMMMMMMMVMMMMTMVIMMMVMMIIIKT